MTEPDLDELVAFANVLADTARGIVTGYFRSPLDVQSKADATPVTIADRETEETLRSLIRERFPEHGVLGEEYGHDGADGPYTWVIDPIDGTKNFVSGLPIFGTLIALLAANRPLLGVLDASMLGERWLGVTGRPTLMNTQRCHTRDCGGLDNAVLFATSIDMFQGADKERFEALSATVRFRRFGADCYAYGLLASGFVDLVMETDMEPYDYMPMMTIIEGAGGKVSDWRGAPLDLHSDGRVLAAATPTLHARALALIQAV